jgi:hypothetical protein
MKRFLPNILLINILLLSSLLSACQPAPVPENALQDPTKPPPASTSEPEESTEEEQFLDQHDFIVLSTEEERFPVVALGSGGQVLAPLLVEGDELSPENVQGAVWEGGNDSEENIVVTTGEDGLPAAMQVGEYVVLFADYTETTVSLALFQGDELISLVADVALDAELLARYQELLSSSTQASSGTASLLSVIPPRAESSLGRMFEMVGLMINLGACTASLAFPPTAWLTITACGSALLTAVTTFTGEDLNIFGAEVPLILVDAVGCLAGEPIACASTIIDAIVFIVDSFYDVLEANQEVYEEARDDLGCPSWFVYAETEWDGCAMCATGPDLDQTREQALIDCKEACGQDCQIMREPYCETEP